MEKTTFLIHKHDATHLHYDLRIHIGDSLASWALPKGVPQKIGEKHLAIRTPNHALAWGHFEGTIPEGHYGAGTVEIWDHGTCYNLKTHNEKPVSFKTCLSQGQLEFTLEGTKKRASYALIRYKGRAEDQWLLIKIKTPKSLP